MECRYCERSWGIQPGVSRFYLMYRNEQETIPVNDPGAYCDLYRVSAVSFPVFHFCRDAAFLLISAVGCNTTCEGCISRYRTHWRGTPRLIAPPRAPEEIPAIACEGDCLCAVERERVWLDVPASELYGGRDS